MGRTVGADQSCTIDGETHRQFLNGNVVDDLIEGALQESRINRRERFQTNPMWRCRIFWPARR